MNFFKLTLKIRHSFLIYVVLNKLLETSFFAAFDNVTKHMQKVSSVSKGNNKVFSQ